MIEKGQSRKFQVIRPMNEWGRMHGVLQTKDVKTFEAFWRPIVGDCQDVKTGIFQYIEQNS